MANDTRSGERQRRVAPAAVGGQAKILITARIGSQGSWRRRWLVWTVRLPVMTKAAIRGNQSSLLSSRMRIAVLFSRVKHLMLRRHGDRSSRPRKLYRRPSQPPPSVLSRCANGGWQAHREYRCGNVPDMELYTQTTRYLGDPLVLPIADVLVVKDGQQVIGLLGPVVQPSRSRQRQPVVP